MWTLFGFWRIKHSVFQLCSRTNYKNKNPICSHDKFKLAIQSNVHFQWQYVCKLIDKVDQVLTCGEMKIVYKLNYWFFFNVQPYVILVTDSKSVWLSIHANNGKWCSVKYFKTSGYASRHLDSKDNSTPIKWCPVLSSIQKKNRFLGHLVVRSWIIIISNLRLWFMLITSLFNAFSFKFSFCFFLLRFHNCVTLIFLSIKIEYNISYWISMNIVTLFCQHFLEIQSIQTAKSV